MLTKASCSTSSAQSLRRVIRTATANSFAELNRYRVAKARWSRSAQRASRSESCSGAGVSGRFTAILAFLPIDIGYTGLAVEYAAKHEQQIGEPVQVVLQRRRQRLRRVQGDDPAFRPPAHCARDMAQRRTARPARQDEFL